MQKQWGLEHSAKQCWKDSKNQSRERKKEVCKQHKEPWKFTVDINAGEWRVLGVLSWSNNPPQKVSGGSKQYGSKRARTTESAVVAQEKVLSNGWQVGSPDAMTNSDSGAADRRKPEN